MYIHNHFNIGFIGSGNMAQTIIKGWLDTQTVQASRLFVSNRSPGKLKKVAEDLKVTPLSNEELVEKCEIVILAMKPQDLISAVEPLQSAITEDHIIFSLAAGMSLTSLQQALSSTQRVVRLMPNTPLQLRRGVLGYSTYTEGEDLSTLVEDLFSPLGLVIPVDEGEAFEALTVATSSGVGFIFELMQYWQEWLEEYGFDSGTAKAMTLQTFLGASELAHESPMNFSDLQAKVTSKKGVTAAGLDSMRELEVERALRYSFEKAALRDRELGKT